HFLASTFTSPFPLHDALPIWPPRLRASSPASCFRSTVGRPASAETAGRPGGRRPGDPRSVRTRARERSAILDALEAAEDLGGLRSEEHTSELQSRFDLVCRLL